MSDVTLELCPWCGSDAYVNLHYWHAVVCRKCSAEGPAADTEADAIAAWNTRQATASSLAAENARLRAALAEASGSLCTAYCSHNAITGDLIQHRVQCTRLTAALKGE